MNHEEMSNMPDRRGPRMAPVGWVQAVLVPHIILVKVRARMPARMYCVCTCWTYDARLVGNDKTSMGQFTFLATLAYSALGSNASISMKPFATSFLGARTSS